MNHFEPNKKERLINVAKITAKSAAGALPVIGGLVSEIIDSIIPDLRFERVVSFLQNLDDKVSELDEKISVFQENLKSEEGLDIFEEGMFQASRAVSNDRKERLARLVANSLTTEHLKYEETRKLLNLYNELTDPELVCLIYYSLNPVLGLGPHSDWINQHPEILKPISRELSAPQEQREKAALQDSYKLTLYRLGLISEPTRSVKITALGYLMVRYISSVES
jgi:hypothetical protein